MTSSRKAILPLVSWLVISMQANRGLAWLILPQTPSISTRPSLPLAAVSSYHAHHRRSRIILSSFSSPSVHDLPDPHLNNDNEQTADDAYKETEPIIRSLYDAPPQLPNSDDKNNRTEVNENDSNESAFATQVTPGTLPTEEGSSHVLYYEVHRRFRREDAAATDAGEDSRNKRGLTALFLHGGPGAGCFPNHVRFFSPQLYETVVLLDQRGCGRSTPLGETRNNTLELLVGDVERLRAQLLGGEARGEDDAAVAQPWDVILGGSWGCTLALAYAHSYPDRVRAMVLRGVCLFRNQEIDWLFADPPLSRGISNGAARTSDSRTSNLRSLLQGGNSVEKSTAQSFRRGAEAASVVQTAEPAPTIPEMNTASEMFPDGWTEFDKGSNIGTQATSSSMTSNPRRILRRYYNLLLGSDPIVRFKAVKSWMRWEMGIYSSGFRGTKAEVEHKTQDPNNTVLVWNPDAAKWLNEDVRVFNNESVASVDVIPKEVKEETAQRLRRYSLAWSVSERPTLSASSFVDPIPIEPVIGTPNKSRSAPKTSSGGANNSTFDPTTYIPAQSMLTCYYSTNDDYCIGSFKPFLSLTPPPSVPYSAWYSSNLPPQKSDSRITMTSFPLPPTIAIQGGNDAICPPDTALDLHDVWREMELRIVLEGGHSMYGDAVAGEIVKALDRFGHALGTTK